MNKQLFFASACIRCGLYRQAEMHLKRALGGANLLRDDHAKGRIMRALNIIRHHFN